ncbi:hypothetical protein BOX15_Mlig005955g1, partial [Macrostomum lignano]
EDYDVFSAVKSLETQRNLYRTLFPYVLTTGISLNFTYLPIRGLFEDASHAETVQQNLTMVGAAAVLSDYYISLAIASYSMEIPYFIIKKNVFSFPPGTPNIFEIQIDNYHLSEALYSVSLVYKRTSLVAVSDGTPASSQFLVNFDRRVFSVHTIRANSSDEQIYNLFARYNPNTLSSGMGWIMLFDEPNLPLMERALTQASRVGIFVSSQYFFLPSLFDSERYLTKFYRSEVEFYAFRLSDHNKYSQSEMLQPFLLDCMNHFLKSFSRWSRSATSATLTETIATETSIVFPLTGPFTYNESTHVRSKVQIDVFRSNRSKPESDIFSLTGKWINDGTSLSPYRPEYNGAGAISRSLIVFAAYETEPYFYSYNSATKTARGLCIEIVEAMRLHLGFEYKLIPVKSQNEVFEMVKNGSADVSLNFLSPTFDRVDHVDLSVDMVQEGIQMLRRKVVHSTDFLHVFHPFSFYVWVSIVIAIVLLSATLYACDKISPNTENQRMYSPYESFFLVLSSFLMSKVETEPKKLSSRLFTLLLWFSTLLYMTTYLSNLVAFLIKPEGHVFFASVGDLADSKGYKWGYIRDSLVDTEVQTYWPKVHARAVREWPDEMYLNSTEEAVAKVLADPNFILIASADTLSYVKNKDCKLTVMGNIANSHFLTWFYRKGFRFEAELTNQLKTRKDVEFAQLRSKYFDLNRCYSGQTDIENKVPLGFEYLCGLFVLLGIGIVLGFLQLLSRWVIHQLRERRRIKNAKNVRFKLGHAYLAEVLVAKPDGVYIRISGDNEVRFMNNSYLHHCGEEEAGDLCNSHLKGKLIQVRYLGKCSINKNAKIFVRQSGGDIAIVDANRTIGSICNSDNEDTSA